MLVGRPAPLGHDPLPSLPRGTLPRRRAFDRDHAPQRRPERQVAQQPAPRLERPRPHVAAIEPQDVEEVISHLSRPSPHPRDLAVEDRVPHGQVPDRLGDGRVVLRPAIAREQTDLRSLLEREQPDAVELALEDPLRAREPLLRQRRRHGLEPFGECGRHREHRSP